MLSTHNMGSVEELCDHIALIDRSRKVLDGRVRDIRRQYATNTYRIEYKGPEVAFANALSFTGELLDVRNGEDAGSARVRIAKDGTLNQVLKQVLTAVEVRGVHEEMPQHARCLHPRRGRQRSRERESRYDRLEAVSKNAFGSEREGISRPGEARNPNIVGGYVSVVQRHGCERPECSPKGIF